MTLYNEVSGYKLTNISCLPMVLMKLLVMTSFNQMHSMGTWKGCFFNNNYRIHNINIVACMDKRKARQMVICTNKFLCIHIDKQNKMHGTNHDTVPEGLIYVISHHNATIIAQCSIYTVRIHMQCMPHAQSSVPNHCNAYLNATTPMSVMSFPSRNIFLKLN